MKTKIKQLRESIVSGVIKNDNIDRLILEAELTFIEARHMEEYFLIAHRLFSELKKNQSVRIGPGWNWMISSHVCYALGLTNISPVDLGISPIFTWGDVNSDLTINIEVDDDSFHFVFEKAIDLFGYNNVARMPVMDEKNSNLKNHHEICIKKDGTKVHLHAFALLICPEGIAKYYNTEEIVDKTGRKILCINEFVGECDNKTVLRFNVLLSSELTRIKKIQRMIAANGKAFPNLYEDSIYDENYAQFYPDDLNDIPLFEWRSSQVLLKKLMSPDRIVTFNKLINIQGLLYLRGNDWMYDEEKIAEEQEKRGVLNILGKKMFPWGILYKEDAAWFLCSCGGLSWKQTAQVLLLSDAKEEHKAEKLKHMYLHQGMDNGIKEEELNRVWHSLFEREKDVIPRKAHNAGRIYLSVFMGRLKHDFPEEFTAIKEE